LDTKNRIITRKLKEIDLKIIKIMAANLIASSFKKSWRRFLIGISLQGF
jgi:hypothetical protein